MEASVIIPTYNRAAKLRSCLAALSEQTQPASDFEVIVVVDGSTDETARMLAETQTHLRLRVIHQSNSGQPAALNRGVAEARGRVVIFLDDDIIVTPRFVSEHICLHKTGHQVVGVGQLTLTLPPEADCFTRGFAQGWRRHYDEFNSGSRKPDWDDCYGGNMSVSRAIFIEVGGNTTDLRRGYDVELAYRLKQHGCSFEYLPEAQGNQYESKGFRELSADSEFAGEASVKLARRYPATERKLLRHFQENRLSWIVLWHILAIGNFSTQGMERLYRWAGRVNRSFPGYVFFSHYYFWRGVRRAAPERTTWKQIILKKRAIWRAG